MPRTRREMSASLRASSPEANAAHGAAFIPRRAPSGSSAGAIRHHYDVAPSFYRLWLGEGLVYSGALWAERDTLDDAQRRKLDHHVAESSAAGKRRVLDIGCGWGALLARLVGHHGVQEAVGLTLSPSQADWIARRHDPRVDVRLESWADHRPTEPYDAIISIGAFEHFAKTEDDDGQKVASYAEFFQKCRDWLRPDGRLSLQTFAYGSARRREAGLSSEATKFLEEQIFPETDPPRLANIAEAIEGTFEIVRLRNDRLDYARTCREWLDRLKAHRAEAAIEVGEETVAKYERYLTYSYIGFRTGRLDLYRITLAPVPKAWTPT